MIYVPDQRNGRLNKISNPEIVRLFFMARDEVIDVLSNVDDFWNEDMDESTLTEMSDCTHKRLKNALKILDDLRKELGITDRPHDSVAGPYDAPYSGHERPPE